MGTTSQNTMNCIIARQQLKAFFRPKTMQTFCTFEARDYSGMNQGDACPNHHSPHSVNSICPPRGPTVRASRHNYDGRSQSFNFNYELNESSECNSILPTTIDDVYGTAVALSAFVRQQRGHTAFGRSSQDSDYAGRSQSFYADDTAFE